MYCVKPDPQQPMSEDEAAALPEATHITSVCHAISYLHLLVTQHPTVTWIITDDDDKIVCRFFRCS